jgi:hypothetical protein
MFRTIFTPENESQLVITLPKECLHKKVEIKSIEMDDLHDTISERNEKRKKTLAFLSTLPKVDMTNFKFDREEANER